MIPIWEKGYFGSTLENYIAINGLLNFTSS